MATISKPSVCSLAFCILLASSIGSLSLAARSIDLRSELNLKQKNALNDADHDDFDDIVDSDSVHDVPDVVVSAESGGPSSARNPCADNEHPNILFILLDDLGWGDVSYRGGIFPTPNIDALLFDSVQLNRHYVHLMCSPSRTQYLTGRYAMNLGFGVFQPWDDSEIGGIPIGQPTVANWLSEFGEYTTYGAGKWHLGYANGQLLPEANGFHHFYGFYQGAIDYVDKTYNDIENGDIGVYDFFEDGDPDYTVIHDQQNTMDLYSQKIQQYMAAEGEKKAEGLRSPWFLYAALQSMHVPFPDLPEYAGRCRAYLDGSVGSEQYLNERARYCALLLLTDKVIGEIIGSVRANDLWADTLIIFTSDNGGETARGASNYPFRGTKGELYEGNTRVITSVSGGVIERAGLFGSVREQIASNLDWTPTLLHFAGYLECIAPSEYSWDGVDQHAVIMGSEGAAEREHLVLNIGDSALRSASMVLRHDGALYKFMATDSNSATDRWIYSGSLSDVWSTLEDPADGATLRILDFVDGDERTKFSQLVDDHFLFDLSSDESELYNLLNPELPHFDEARNREIVAKCEGILEAFMANNELFSAPINALHSRMELGDPSLTADGLFVRPFLNDKFYKIHLLQIFETESERGHFHSEQQLALYLEGWDCPEAVAPDSVHSESALAADTVTAAGSVDADNESLGPIMKTNVVNFVFGGEGEGEDTAGGVLLRADDVLDDVIGDDLVGGPMERERVEGGDDGPFKWWMMVPVAAVVVAVVMVLIFYGFRLGSGAWHKVSAQQKEGADYESVSDENDDDDDGLRGYGSVAIGSFESAYDDVVNCYSRDSVHRDGY